MADHWTKDGNFFVCDSYKYGLLPDGRTVYVGPAEEKRETADNPRNNVDKPPDRQEVVAKIEDKGIVPVGFLQHNRGRPRKEGEVHRTTIWRRQKEKVEQGVLL